MTDSTRETDELQLPSGFQFSGIHCGLKESANDLSVILCDAPSTAAGVYTQNLVRAASIDWNRNITPTPSIRAVVINSGNANACTGDQGERDNAAMAAAVAKTIGCEPEQIATLSTGIIGHPLPMDRITSGIQMALAEAGSEQQHFLNAVDGIMTTDRFRKTHSESLTMDGSRGVIAGMAKGAGMIGPNMATMLAVVMTDWYLPPQIADQALKKAVDASFNCISVEGHTSTNDAVLLLSSSVGRPIHQTEQIQAFEAALTDSCIALARQIPSDGEGASHLIEIRVRGTQENREADRIARTVANSALVKTAITGADPNWGRIVSAAGYAGVDFNIETTSLQLNGHSLFEAGQPIPFDAAVVSDALSSSFTSLIELRLGSGPGQATHWTSDLTVDYVRLNSEYTT